MKSTFLRRVASTTRCRGIITEWHPFERRGVIEELLLEPSTSTTSTVVKKGTARRFQIPNTRAFETVLPTMHRNLNGAQVTFDIAAESIADETTRQAALKEGLDRGYEGARTDRVIIRSRAAKVTSDAYRRASPVDHLASFRIAPDGEVSSGTAALKPSTSASTTVKSPRTPAATEQEVSQDKGNGSTGKEGEGAGGAATVRLIACNIVLDVLPASLTQPAAGSPYMEGFAPPHGRRDLRPSVVLDGKALAQMRHGIGLGQQEMAGGAGNDNTPSVDGASAAAPDAPPPRVRKVSAETFTGTVVAWSAIQRTGLIVLGVVQPGEEIPVVQDPVNAFPILNVSAFDSAMPTSVTLANRRVTFRVVTYQDQATGTHTRCAEHIQVHGDLGLLQPTSEEVAKKKLSEKEDTRRSNFSMVFDEYDAPLGESTSAAPIASSGDAPSLQEKSGTVAESSDGNHNAKVTVDPSSPVDPATPIYGVITRWSGGQGTIETANRRLYYIKSAAEFQQLVDQSSSAVRGAVVTFCIDPKRPRYATKVSLLNFSPVTTSTSQYARKPMLVNKRGAEESSDDDVQSGEVRRSPLSIDDLTLPDTVVWRHGFVITWSQTEEQGILVCDDDNERYLLKDAEENVFQYKETKAKALLRKGRRVKFTAFGGTGRLACNVVMLDAEADAEALRLAELRQAEEPKPIHTEGNVNEAIASPMSTSYWMSKMERVGFDVSEIRNRQKDAVPPELKDDDPLLDPEEIFKNDRWFKDKERNIKLPGTDMTAGNFAHIAPSAMMTVAAKIRDPVKLEKMKDKYYNRLTEDMKAQAWQQAKEMAPRYTQRMREAREKGEEPVFHFL